MSTSTSGRRTKKRKQTTLLAIIVALVVILSASIYTILRLSYDKVYEGVYIENVSIGGMTAEEVRAKIPTLKDISQQYYITIRIGDASEQIYTKVLAPAFDTEEMTSIAMQYGREKKGIARLSSISDLKRNPVHVPYVLRFNDRALQQVLDKLTAKLNITAVDNKIEIGDNTITITRGVPGLGIDYQEVKAAITECVLTKTDVATVQLKQISPEEITVDYIKRHTQETPVDATHSIVDHRLVITQSNPGVTLNEKEVKRAIKEQEGSAVLTIPAKIKHPEVSTESLQNTLIAHKLSSYSSDYSSSSSDRAHNIQLASDKINGYVLAPGEEFSYNDVVGPRTPEHGFRIANVYVGNTVQPGIGGGICQVSSTLFNAAVLADLDITERKNHTLPVSYVPLGRDATVSYGSIDFKFKNNYDSPIEIRVECVGRKNIISIYGSNERPNRKIEIRTEQTGTSSPKVVQKEDPTLEEGVVKVETKGTNGSSHIAYKITYENGEQVSRQVLCKSVYAGKDQIELVGTKKPEATPSPSADPSASPSEDPAAEKPGTSAKPSHTPSPSADTSTLS